MPTTSPGRAFGLVLSPNPPPARTSGLALAVLRIIAGLLWLAHVWWKLPPDFGESRRTGLWFWTHLAVDHPVFPPYSWLVEHLILPNFTPFGWLVLVVETLLAVYVQLGRVEIWLGGNPSTAAVFVCAAVIALGARPLRVSS
jgi:hypothetical protein